MNEEIFLGSIFDPYPRDDPLIPERCIQESERSTENSSQTGLGFGHLGSLISKKKKFEIRKLDFTAVENEQIFHFNPHKFREPLPPAKNTPPPYKPAPGFDFDSDSEESKELPRAAATDKSPAFLRFLASKTACELLSSLPLNAFIIFPDWFPPARNQPERKSIECEICGKVFKTGQSKGGHMSKRHPNENRRLRKRKLVTSIGINERKRRNFFKSFSEE